MKAKKPLLAPCCRTWGGCWCSFNFPDEASQIRNLVQATREPQTEKAASITVLGLTLGNLGLGIAKAW